MGPAWCVEMPVRSLVKIGCISIIGMLFIDNFCFIVRLPNSLITPWRFGTVRDPFSLHTQQFIHFLWGLWPCWLRRSGRASGSTKCPGSETGDEEYWVFIKWDVCAVGASKT